MFSKNLMIVFLILMLLLPSVNASPIITIDSPLNQTYNSTNLEISWSSSTKVYDAKYSLNENLNVSLVTSSTKEIEDSYSSTCSGFCSGDVFDEDYNSGCTWTSETCVIIQNTTISEYWINSTHALYFTTSTANDQINISCWDFTNIVWLLLREDIIGTNYLTTELTVLPNDCISSNNKTQIKFDIYEDGVGGGETLFEDRVISDIPDFSQNIISNENSNNLTLWVNDTNGNINQTTVYFTVTNQVSFSDNSTNSTHWGSNVKHSQQITSSLNDLSGYIFSFDNGTGTFVNDTFASLTGLIDWSNVTKTVNSTVGSTIRWQVHANTSADVWSSSSIYSYVITNTLPVVSDVTIVPVSPQNDDDLNVTYTFTDDDRDLEQDTWFQWYINGIPNETTRILSSGNTSLLDEVICSVKVFDGIQNSTWVNSSVVTVTDTVLPVLHTQSLTPASGEVNTAFVVRINITELNPLTWVYVQITDPNSASTNYTMSEELTTGLEYNYNKTYTPSLVGDHFFHFFARDNSGNIGEIAGSSDYSSTAVGGGDSPGGGGGGAPPITQICGDQICSGGETTENCPEDCILDYTMSPDELMITMFQDAKETGRFKIINDGLLEKTITLVIEPKDKFMVRNSNGQYVYEATYTLPKKSGLLSGETYISYQVDLENSNYSLGQYNYTIKFDDDKNIMFYDVTVEVREFTWMSAKIILPAILVIIFIIMIFPVIRKKFS